MFAMRPKGFADVAAFFSSDPDHGSTVFRRFDQVALRNLLYLQARLAALEAEQHRYDQEDDKDSGIRTTNATSSWLDLARLAAEPNGEHERKRMELAIKIQEAVKIYQEALVLHGQVLALSKPAETTLRAFTKYFQPTDDVTRLRRESAKFLDDANDLATLRSALSHDRLTSFVLNNLGGAFAQSNGDTDVVRAQTLSRVVSLISTVIAAMLLVGAVATLNYASSQWHMAILATFTAAFACTVAILTNASRAEVFSAACAYTAVLVVFVGTNGTSCNCPSPNP